MPVIASATEGVATFDVEGLARVAQTVLDAAEWGQWELSLLLCDDAFIAPLNRQWRSKDGPTDVLSFPQIDPAAGVPVEPGLLGDVVISLDTAQRQADELGHPVEQEVRILLVHGVSHLLGHTHHDTEDTPRMLALEARLLTAIGLGEQGLIGRSQG